MPGRGHRREECYSTVSQSRYGAIPRGCCPGVKSIRRLRFSCGCEVVGTLNECWCCCLATSLCLKQTTHPHACPYIHVLCCCPPAQDNGSGMPHKDIPNMLGRVLSGTKYGVKQTRGKFGLAAKMALIWSKMTTGLPFTIESACVMQDFRSHYVLDIDIHRCVLQALVITHTAHAAVSVTNSYVAPRHALHTPATAHVHTMLRIHAMLH